MHIDTHMSAIGKEEEEKKTQTKNMCVVFKGPSKRAVELARMRELTKILCGKITL